MAYVTRCVNLTGPAAEPGYRWIAFTHQVTALHVVRDQHLAQVTALCWKQHGEHDPTRTAGSYCWDCLSELQRIHDSP